MTSHRSGDYFTGGVCRLPYARKSSKTTRAGRQFTTPLAQIAQRSTIPPRRAARCLSNAGLGRALATKAFHYSHWRAAAPAARTLAVTTSLVAVCVASRCAAAKAPRVQSEFRPQLAANVRARARTMSVYSLEQTFMAARARTSEETTSDVDWGASSRGIAARTHCAQALRVMPSSLAASCRMSPLCCGAGALAHPHRAAVTATAAISSTKLRFTVATEHPGLCTSRQISPIE